MERGPGCLIHGWWQLFCSWFLGVPQGQPDFFLISWWVNAGLKNSSFQPRAAWPPWFLCLDFSSSSLSPPSFCFLLWLSLWYNLHTIIDVLISKCMIQRFFINVVQLSQFNFSTFWSPICSHFWFLFGNGKPGSSFPTISSESWYQRKELRGSSFK